MHDLNQNNTVVSKYQDPVLPRFYLPAQLRYNILKPYYHFEAGMAFYEALKKSSPSELTMMRETVFFLIREMNLIQVPETEFSLKSVFSLKEFHKRLVIQLRYCDDDEKIALLHANQWLTFFYKDNKDNSVKNLQRIMRDYALALEGKKMEEFDISLQILIPTLGPFALIVLAIFVFVGVIKGPWLGPLVLTAAVCLLAFLISFITETHAEAHTRKYENELKALTLPDTLEDAVCSEDPLTMPVALKSLSDLIEALKNDRNVHYINFSEFNNKIYFLSDLDNKEYQKIQDTLNELSVASRYKRKNEILAEKFRLYVIFSIAATSLVALSIALTHTKHMDQLVFGSFLAIYLGTLAVLSLDALFNARPEPRINHALRQEKIDELKAIHKNLEQKLSEKPAPPSNQDTCYQPQAGGGMFLQYLLTREIPSAPPVEPNDESKLAHQCCEAFYNGSNNNFGHAKISYHNNFGHP